MSRKPRDSRVTARRRLVTGFLNSLPEELQALIALAHEVEDDDDWESVSHTVKRLGDTAETLLLTSIAAAAREAANALGKTSIEKAFAPLMKAIRATSSAGPFAPIAVVGEKQGTIITSQDDGTCEPLQLFADIDQLLRLVVEWPQTVVLSASEVHRIPELKTTYGCSVYVYGAARDQDARMAAGASGADGYLAEPVVLPHLLSSMRFRNSLPERNIEVALLGPKEWSAPLLPGLSKENLRPTAFTEIDRVGSVLHSLFPDVVVLHAPDTDSVMRVMRMIRTHVGRSHVAVLVIGDRHDHQGLGCDGFLGPDEPLAPAIREVAARMSDHHRDRDVLTQLPNRAGILASAQRALAWSERHGDTLSIAMVRAHGLDRAASEFGMEAANACRRHLAISLERGLRRLDEVGYLGNDLYCAVLYNTTATQVEPRLNVLCKNFTTRAHADRRLREITLTKAVVDTTAGVRGLLPRGLRLLSSIS